MCSVGQIVLPMVGAYSQMPTNAVRDAFLRLLERDGLKPESFVPRQREFNLPGSYRHLVERPKNVSS